ncbi:MAG: DNA topoisomerase IV subunit A [Rickettsiales bacterium]|jgi:topoisomerase-4 subunit A|nr:DNA topoisomerase IV subunit A [Rickettsiales bacterium]
MPEIKENIDSSQLIDALSERYLSYAVSTIVARAMPDVRDGLKPVHRRILFSMLKQKLDPKAGFRKCATVVGDVLGHYHPHGDSSVYDAMVRLAQDFSVRYPLVDGQGNFGNIDGDPAAAYRYTESKMTEAAMRIMTGLEDDAVDFAPNFDGTASEPVVMPGAFPNLLANGSAGIAVGMATNIPTHNVAEVMDALMLVLDKPEATTSQIMRKLVGPDFPTGGVLIDGFDAIVRNYETGKGAFRVRAKWHAEELERGKYQIVITEIPYEVAGRKTRLVEQIAEMIDQKKLPLVDDIADESAADVRIVITPKNREIPAETLMAHLFQSTELESRFNMNFNVVDSLGSPRVMPIREVLTEFLTHQRNVLLRRAQHRLSNIARRLEVLAGLLITYLNLDRVIKIIRESEEPKAELIKAFDLTEVQVEFILNTRLRSLRKLEEMEIKKEDRELRAEQKELNALVKSPEKQNEEMRGIFVEIQNEFSKKTPLGKRRTAWQPAGEEAAVDVDEFIEKEPMTIILSQLGWIRAAKGHLDLDALDDVKMKDGDSLEFAFHATSADKINLFGSEGKMFTLNPAALPGARGFGESVRLMIDLGADEKIVSAFPLNQSAKYLVVGRRGTGFVVDGANCVAQTKSGKQIMNADAKNPAIGCWEIPDGANLMAAFSGSNDKLLVMDIAEIPEMSRGKGVVLQKYNADRTYTMDVMIFPKKEGLSWTTGRGTTKLDDLRPYIGKRATQGQTIPVGFPRSGKFNN